MIEQQLIQYMIVLDGSAPGVLQARMTEVQSVKINVHKSKEI